jgi:hypothetical protein
MKIIRSSLAATPSKAFNRPEKVNLPVYACGVEWPGKSIPEVTAPSISSSKSNDRGGACDNKYINLSSVKEGSHKFNRAI